jgi:hypothetical protein
MRSTLIAMVLFIIGSIFLATNNVEAYPHYQFSSDNNVCATCHFSPGGGSTINDWGRREAANTLSRWDGSGYAFHGLFDLPNWLSVGGDLRAAAMLNDKGESEGTKFNVFPMQAELAMRLTAGPWAVSGSFGLRGRARNSAPPEGSITRSEEGAASFLVSREHYLMYEPTHSSISVRAGRFYAPYGLRLPDHTSYVRRYMGFNMLQETYNLSASQVRGQHETHLSAHVSDVLYGPEDLSFGGTLMHERRWQSSALGGGLKVTRGPGDFRAMLGTHYKVWLEPQSLLLMAELNAGYQSFRDPADTSRLQLIGYMGPVWMPTKGVSAALAYEVFDEDLLVKQVERHSLTYWLSLLPKAHYEIFLLGRAQLIGSQDKVYTGMMQLHYYL